MTIQNHSIVMDRPCLSIIIPAFNASRFIRRAIESVLTQSMQNYELIIIDDGSTDETGAICDEYAAKDSRIRVFHVENGGVSRARNLGITKSEGKYITFIDSDDYIEQDYFPEIFNLDYDLYIQNRRIVGGEDDGQRIPAQKIDKEQLEDFYKSYIHHHIFQEVCCKFFRRDILVKNNIFFDPSYKFGEDTLFSIQYLRYVKSINVLDSANYFYDQTNNSPFYEKYKLEINICFKYLQSFYQEYLRLPYKSRELLAGVYDCFHMAMFKSHYWINNASDEWNSNKVIFLIEYELGLRQGRKNSVRQFLLKAIFCLH